MNNTKTFMVFLGFLCAYFSAQAQVFIGLRGGMQFATYNADHIDYRLENLRGFNVAVPVMYFLGDHLSIYSELAYSQRGSHAITFRTYQDEYGTPLMETQSMQTAVNYLEMPLFLRLASARQGLNAYGFVGPELSMTLNGKTTISKIDGIPLDTPPEAKLNVRGGQPYLERWVIGAAFGVGVNAPLPNGNLFFEARFHLGATDVFANDPNNKITNQGTTLSVGYMVELDR